MDIQTVNLCATAFEDYLHALVQDKLKQKRPDDRVFEAPIIGGTYLVEDIPKVKTKITKARLARAWFGTHAGVQLPLNDEEIARLQHVVDTDSSPLKNLVGLYAASLKECDWNYEDHPSFDRFVSGCLAAPHDYRRYGVALHSAIPAERLPGLDPRTLVWDPLIYLLHGGPVKAVRDSHRAKV
jgi:hypothetical protein